MLKFYRSNYKERGKQMICDKHAKVLMKEGYMRLSIEYSKIESETEICTAINETEKDMKIYPEVIHRMFQDDLGSCSIEFNGDSHAGERIAGEFINKVLKKLNIADCDCGDVIES